ncbi:MAG TPA: hypothetical protein VHL78_07880 [Actinomycetota bacterium]|nr:hypothetical protein [Actinomycetota bacterium]
MSPNAVLWILVLLAAGGAVGLVFYGEEQGWGGGLTVGLAVGLFFAAAIAYAVYDSARKRRRRQAAPEAAALLGLIPAERSSLPHLPFELMSRGQGRTAENAMAGNVDGALWLFDYTYHTTSYNPNTNSTSRNDFYFSCAVGQLRAAGLPAMRISREGFFSRIGRAIGFEDIEVGDRRFDARFKVKASDPAVAGEVLHADLQRWLMALEEEMSFELADGLALAYTKQRELTDLRPLLDALLAFRQQIPQALLERYAANRTEA